MKINSEIMPDNTGLSRVVLRITSQEQKLGLTLEDFSLISTVLVCICVHVCGVIIMIQFIPRASGPPGSSPAVEPRAVCGSRIVYLKIQIVKTRIYFIPVSAKHSSFQNLHSYILVRVIFSIKYWGFVPRIVFASVTVRFAILNHDLAK